jgi:4,5-DOPA dioxygenase extradiol
MPTRMPALFVGHGNPMNAIQRNPYTEAWAGLGRALPRPRAVLSISAHWYVPGTFVTAMESPRTIHDFGGFARELFQVKYPAPGSPELAKRVAALLSPIQARRDEHWGLDHGTWSVLCHLYPEADIPVVQLSVDETQPPDVHYQLGKTLRALRDEGVLVLGSGNLVHNLHTYAWGRQPAEPLDWALRFEQEARRLMVAGAMGPLIAYEEMGRDALLAIPTPDHYLPLLYVLAQRQDDDAITFPVEGIDGGSVSMLAVQIGG